MTVLDRERNQEAFADAWKSGSAIRPNDISQAGGFSISAAGRARARAGRCIGLRRPQPERRILVEVEHDANRRTAVLKAGVEYPGRAEAVEPRAVGDEWRLIHVARDHHRRLVLRDPLHQFDVAEESLAAPTRRRIRRRCMMHPDPALRPPGRGVTKLGFETALDQRSVPPRTHRETVSPMVRLSPRRRCRVL